jgi:hypothetical protein
VSVTKEQATVWDSNLETCEEFRNSESLKAQKQHGSATTTWAKTESLFCQSSRALHKYANGEDFLNWWYTIHVRLFPSLHPLTVPSPVTPQVSALESLPIPTLRLSPRNSNYRCWIIRDYAPNSIYVWSLNTKWIEIWDFWCIIHYI